MNYCVLSLFGVRQQAAPTRMSAFTVAKNKEPLHRSVEIYILERKEREQYSNTFVGAHVGQRGPCPKETKRIRIQ